MESRRKYDAEFKIQAVELYLSSNKSASSIARDLGICTTNLIRWAREYRNKDLVAFPGHGKPRDEELHRLRKELAEVKQERDILKKAMAIFSKTQK
jgi:transposase